MVYLHTHASKKLSHSQAMHIHTYIRECTDMLTEGFFLFVIVDGLVAARRAYTHTHTHTHTHTLTHAHTHTHKHNLHSRHHPNRKNITSTISQKKIHSRHEIRQFPEKNLQHTATPVMPYLQQTASLFFFLEISQ